MQKMICSDVYRGLYIRSKAAMVKMPGGIAGGYAGLPPDDFFFENSVDEEVNNAKRRIKE
ncbi:hypothetical protein [Chitinophaga sp. CF418]|uniref:hypothetical protein n=1 Tax=Chitinophaga sp. CF418 TaxID=1855287 RepID=UPI0009243CF9|nr:hypothetical protein [Chitinophaga sp. CF418]SHN27522.1 hypothetical protein SAMN05216311_10813 [Chitinophaga sp. CF418]